MRDATRVMVTCQVVYISVSVTSWPKSVTSRHPHFCDAASRFDPPRQLRALLGDLPWSSTSGRCEVRGGIRGGWSPNEGFREGTLRARALARAEHAPHLRSRPANGAPQELICSLYLHGFHLLQPCQVLLSRAFSARGQHDKHMLKLCHRQSQRTKPHSLRDKPSYF